MDLATFIITVYCCIDDLLPQVTDGQRLRQRGPAPRLSDSEVLTMEVVGAFLGIEEDQALYRYFRDCWHDDFPLLATVHRTTFVRQAANLWQVKARLWHALLSTLPLDPGCSIVDSFPLPVCRFSRAKRCRRFRGEAAFGKDAIARQMFYGFKLHVRLGWPGILASCCLAPANVPETDVAPLLAEGIDGLLVGDRGYWSPRLRAELAWDGIELVAPFGSAKHDPWPRRSAEISRLRERIESIFGQLVSRWKVKVVRARDRWHLTNRLLRAFLGHTLAIWLNHDAGHPLLRFDHILS
jgi:hypothetical protein